MLAATTYTLHSKLKYGLLKKSILYVRLVHQVFPTLGNPQGPWGLWDPWGVFWVLGVLGVIGVLGVHNGFMRLVGSFP